MVSYVIIRTMAEIAQMLGFRIASLGRLNSSD
jgi:hypothetical protein